MGRAVRSGSLREEPLVGCGPWPQLSKAEDVDVAKRANVLRIGIGVDRFRYRSWLGPANSRLRAADDK